MLSHELRIPMGAVLNAIERIKANRGELASKDRMVVDLELPGSSSDAADEQAARIVGVSQNTWLHCLTICSTYAIRAERDRVRKSILTSALPRSRVLKRSAYEV